MKIRINEDDWITLGVGERLSNAKLVHELFLPFVFKQGGSVVKDQIEEEIIAIQTVRSKFSIFLNLLEPLIQVL